MAIKNLIDRIKALDESTVLYVLGGGFPEDDHQVIPVMALKESQVKGFLELVAKYEASKQYVHNCLTSNTWDSEASKPYVDILREYRNQLEEQVMTRVPLGEYKEGQIIPKIEKLI